MFSKSEEVATRWSAFFVKTQKKEEEEQQEQEQALNGFRAGATLEEKEEERVFLTEVNDRARSDSSRPGRR